MFSRAWVLTRIGGIEIRLDPSLLLFAALVAFTLVSRFSPEFGTATSIAMTVAGGLLFFASILAHELGHALEARYRGMTVHGVTLFLLGGVTEMHADGQTPRDELAVAAIGPWVSLFCGAVFGIIATFGAALLPSVAAEPVAELAGLLGWLNVVLAGFNLVPGAPLDGGRVLRALLWLFLGDRRRAVTITVRVGQLIGIALVAYAAWGFLLAPQAAVSAALIAMVGVFMFNAARSELRNSDLDALFEAWTVGELVGDPPPPLPRDHNLDLVDPQAWSEGAELIPVRDGDELFGFVRTELVVKLHRTERPVRTAGELAEPLAGLPRIDVGDDLHELIERFQGDHRVVVLTRDGEPFHAVTEHEMAVAVAALRRRRQAPSGRRADTTRGDVEVSG